MTFSFRELPVSPVQACQGVVQVGARRLSVVAIRQFVQQPLAQGNTRPSLGRGEIAYFVTPESSPGQGSRKLCAFFGQWDFRQVEHLVDEGPEVGGVAHHAGHFVVQRPEEQPPAMVGDQFAAVVEGVEQSWEGVLQAVDEDDFVVHRRCCGETGQQVVGFRRRAGLEPLPAHALAHGLEAIHEGVFEGRTGAFGPVDDEEHQPGFVAFGAVQRAKQQVQAALY